MTDFTAILKDVSLEKFGEMFSVLPRQAKQVLGKRLGLKPPKPGRLVAAAVRTAAKSENIYSAILDFDDNEAAEEILRSWLLLQRPMLVAALDHMGLAHQDGLTESNDVEKIATMDKKEIKALMDAICTVCSSEDAMIYIRFMGGTI